jgi:hypothetical protein
VLENYEPITWAEELIEPARAVGHPRLAFLYVMASMCYNTGRINEAVGYSEAGQMAMRSGSGEVPYGIEGLLGGVYVYIGQPERTAEWCRARLARGRDTHTLTGAYLVMALTLAGCAEEARTATTGLLGAAEATRNPHALSFALLAYGIAFQDADPDRARDAMRRGLVIAQDSGNRGDESRTAGVLCRLEATHGDPLAAFEYMAVAIRNYHDAGNTTNLRPLLSFLAAILDRIGRYESAATIAGFAVVSPLATEWNLEISTAITHLRGVLGDQTYESLARKGATMTTAAMANYAYDQIDQARTELEHPS